MRALRCLVGICSVVAVCLASCGPRTVAAPTSIPSPQATARPAATDLRFALIGQPSAVNVWKLFDASGASYANYALRSEYWPRLYHLSLPSLEFQPQAADGMPSDVVADGELYSATVKLRTDLKWTDGSAFSADDVAFTINNALAFELGFDWSAYYSRDAIDHVEAQDSSTVKFIFKQKPNVRVWQYGALQGPIVQKAYWESLTRPAAAMLPDDASRVQVDAARAYLAKIQNTVNQMTAQVTALHLNGQSDRKLEGDLLGSQNELTFAQNSLNKLLAGYGTSMQSARAALFALPASGEPTLGTWTAAAKQDSAWVNAANPDHPFGQPQFQRVLYYPFADMNAAQQALQAGEVDMILDHSGANDLNAAVAGLSGNAHFLIFNTANARLADAALRQALACAIWSPTRDPADALNGFVLPGNDFWRNPKAVTPCSELDATKLDSRLPRAVQILQSAGYTWKQLPSVNTAGSGLALPDGTPFPALNLLSLASADDSLEAQQAKQISDAALQLGIAITVVPASASDIRYMVLSSKRYDLAILSWHLSLYPAYLCEWFGAQGKFFYGSQSLGSGCEALENESNLPAARDDLFQIQSTLAADVPFAPLYADVARERGAVHFPFDSVLGGLSGWYGAPSYAMPSP